MIESHDSTQALLKATHKYLHFIERISCGENFDQNEEASSILSPECKKVLNGQLYTKNRNEFVADLLDVYKNKGQWKITAAEIIPASQNKIVVLRLFIEMKSSGTFTTIVILRYNSMNLITEINEVLNEVKGTYDFKDKK